MGLREQTMNRLFLLIQQCWMMSGVLAVMVIAGQVPASAHQTGTFRGRETAAAGDTPAR
jgi:hypothetical protein